MDWREMFETSLCAQNWFFKMSVLFQLSAERYRNSYGLSRMACIAFFTLLRPHSNWHSCSVILRSFGILQIFSQSTLYCVCKFKFDANWKLNFNFLRLVQRNSNDNFKWKSLKIIEIFQNRKSLSIRTTILCGSRNVQLNVESTFPWSQRIRIPFGRRMTRNCSRHQHQPYYVVVGRREERSKLVRAQYAFLFIHTCD